MPHPPGTKRPNLVFVFPDQMRAQAMGFVGADPVLTPRLDAFAKQSLHLPHACSSHPLCSPYRASLLTGKYPFGHGVITNCNSWGNRFHAFLRPTERCLSDVLHDADYSCGYIGKWHLDPPDAPPAQDWTRATWDAYTPPGPRRHGFDFWHAYGCFNDHLAPRYSVGNARPGEFLHVDKWSPEHEAGVACDFIRNADGKHRWPDQPFALLVSMNPPHTPYDKVPERYRALYAHAEPRALLNRRNLRLEGKGADAEASARDYFAAVSGIDEQFGRILDCLHEQNLDNDTIVIFTADHGEMMGSHGRMYKNVWYNESFLVPFLIRWPGQIPAGRDSLPLAPADIMPTLLDLMGLADRTPDGVEGCNHAGVLRGAGSASVTSAFYLFPHAVHPLLGVRGLRTPQHSFIVDRNAPGPPGPPGPPGSPATPCVTLIDNEQDPYQLTNIADQSPDIVARLTEQLDHWLRVTNDPWGRTQWYP